MADLTAGFIRDRYKTGSEALRKEQFDFRINASFLAGDQWVYYDKVRNTINQLPRDPTRTRAVMNRLWPSSRHLLARLTSRPLVFEVPPDDSDDATVRGARTAEAVLRALYQEHNWEDLRENAAWAAWIGGTSVISFDWDASAGTPLGESAYSGRPYGTGDTCEDVSTILEVAWEPGVRDAEKGYWWVKARALPPPVVQSMYELPKLPAADAMATDSAPLARLLRDDRSERSDNLTLVLTYYERPCKERPQGVVATVVGDKIVEEKPWPFPFKDRLNMVVIRETKVPGRATGDTVLSAAVPVQAAFNASWSNIIEHMKLAGNARLMVPEAALDNVEDLSDLPGEIVPYNAAAGAPGFLSPPQMPQWWIEEPERLARQMDDILGVHDVSRGITPANIESGVGLSVLVEQDQTPLGQFVREVGHAFERLGYLILRTYEVKAREPRKAKIRVPGEVPETVAWTGADLKGQIRPRIPIDAIMPRSRVASMALAKEMWDRKITQDPEIFVRIADLPDADHLLDALDPDASKAARENHRMCQGEVELPADFDNHPKHIERHNVFRKTKEYESLPSDRRAVVDKHIKAHEVMEAEQQGLQAAKMAVHPLLGAAATAHEATPLAAGLVPPPVPGVPSGREGEVAPPGAEGGAPLGVPQQ